MQQKQFHNLLKHITKTLLSEAQTSKFKSSQEFEHRARDVISDYLNTTNSTIKVDYDSHPQAFPDICLGEFGIEVKFTEKDTWRGISNSISQSMKNDQVQEIWVLWCKQGGDPEIKYRKYEDVVMHVRTSHVPRFEIDMKATESLFDLFKIDYHTFSALDMTRKMDLVREYVRTRKRRGLKQHFWFLETQDIDAQPPSYIKHFTRLKDSEKYALSVSELILFPEILAPKNKEYRYDTRVMFLLHAHKVLYPQTYTLFETIPSALDVHLSSDPFSEKYVFNVSEVLKDMPIHYVRLYSTWWDGRKTPTVDQWLDKVKTVLDPRSDSPN